MFNLPNIWDRVLPNTSGLTLKRHVPVVENANSSQPKIPTHLNQPNIPTESDQPKSLMQFFASSEHVHRTSENPHKVQYFSSPSDLMKSSCWLDEILSSTTNVLLQRRIYLLLNVTTEWEIYTKIFIIVFIVLQFMPLLACYYKHVWHMSLNKYSCHIANITYTAIMLNIQFFYQYLPK